MDNHGFRYYDSELGRYLTRDPAGYVDGPNVYLYVNNNPINSIDPLGLAEDDDPNWHHMVQDTKENRKLFEKAGWDEERVKKFRDSYGQIATNKDHIQKDGIHSKGWQKDHHNAMKKLYKEKGAEGFTEENIKKAVDKLKDSDKYRDTFARTYEAPMDYKEWHKKEGKTERRAFAKDNLKKLSDAYDKGDSFSKLKGMGKKFSKALGYFSFATGALATTNDVLGSETQQALRKAIERAKAGDIKGVENVLNQRKWDLAEKSSYSFVAVNIGLLDVKKLTRPKKEFSFFKWLTTNPEQDKK